MAVTPKSETTKPLLYFNYFGRFRVDGPDGADLTPKSRKAQALLVLLAWAPQNMRARSWLEAQLWSRQHDQQAYNSLRQALAAIRRSFGDYRGCILLKDGVVALRPGTVSAPPDLVKMAQQRPSNSLSPPFLEGLDLTEPTFSQWLAQRRASLAGKTDWVPHETLDPNTRPRNVRLFFDTDGKNSGPLSDISALIGDQITQALAEHGSVEILSGQCEPADTPVQSDMILQAIVHEASSRTAIRLRLQSAFNGSTFWSGIRTVSGNSLEALDDVAIQKLSNTAIDTALADYANQSDCEQSGLYPAVMSFQAVRAMFRLGADNLQAAERMLEDAHAADPKGIYLGWRAYLRIILMGERMLNDPQVTRAEAQQFISMALERDPGNSMVLALASYVQTMLFRNYHAGGDLAKVSIENRPNNPLAWAFLGIARMHLGEPEEGYRNALHAIAISGPGPHVYQLNMLACQTAAVSGRFSDAIRFGEMTHALAPGYAPPLRYLAALNRAEGHDGAAAKVLDKLLKIEPDFSYELLLDKSYPVAALRRTELLKQLARRRAG